jgi:hypothetical protein
MAMKTSINESESNGGGSRNMAKIICQRKSAKMIENWRRQCWRNDVKIERL